AHLRRRASARGPVAAERRAGGDVPRLHRRDRVLGRGRHALRDRFLRRKLDARRCRPERQPPGSGAERHEPLPGAAQHPDRGSARPGLARQGARTRRGAGAPGDSGRRLPRARRVLPDRPSGGSAVRRTRRFAVSLVAALLLAALGSGGGLAAGRRLGSRPSGAPGAAGAEGGGATPSAAVGVVSSGAIEAGGGESPHRAERGRARVVAAAASGEHMGGAAPRIALDRPTPSGVGVEIHGRDPIAPRALELWRIAGARAVLAARGASRADGTLAFAPFVLPAGERALVPAPGRPGALAPRASAPVSTSRD